MSKHILSNSGMSNLLGFSITIFIKLLLSLRAACCRQCFSEKKNSTRAQKAQQTEENPALTKFDTSIFTGEYIVPPAKDYFENIEKQRSDDAKADKAWKDSSDSEQLDIFNI